MNYYEQFLLKMKKDKKNNLIKEFNILNEKYGSNDIVDIITNQIYSLINKSHFELILKKEIILENKIENIDEIVSIDFEKNNRIIIDFVDTIMILKKTNRNYASINQNFIIKKNTDDYNKNYKISNLILTFEIKNNPNTIIKNIISHEILHLIELTYSYKKSNSWKQNIILKKLNLKYQNDINWQNISHMIYLTLQHEIRANISEVANGVKYLNFKKATDATKYIKQTNNYIEFSNIKNINISSLIKIMKRDNNYYSIINDFNVEFLKKTNKINFENNFRNYFQNIVKKNANKALNKLEKISYIYENDKEFNENIHIYQTGQNENRNIDYRKYI